MKRCSRHVVRRPAPAHSPTFAFTQIKVARSQTTASCSNIYVNSEYCSHFSIREEQSSLAHAAISRNKKSLVKSLVRHSVPFYQAQSNGQPRNEHPRSHRPKF